WDARLHRLTWGLGITAAHEIGDRRVAPHIEESSYQWLWAQFPSLFRDCFLTLFKFKPEIFEPLPQLLRCDLQSVMKLFCKVLLQVTSFLFRSSDDLFQVIFHGGRKRHQP